MCKIYFILSDNTLNNPHVVVELSEEENKFKYTIIFIQFFKKMNRIIFKMIQILTIKIVGF